MNKPEKSESEIYVGKDKEWLKCMDSKEAIKANRCVSNILNTTCQNTEEIEVDIENNFHHNFSLANFTGTEFCK